MDQPRTQRVGFALANHAIDHQPFAQPDQRIDLPAVDLLAVEAGKQVHRHSPRCVTARLRLQHLMHISRRDRTATLSALEGMKNNYRMVLTTLITVW